ncbi:metallophosphoesterase family protein [Ciceribacter azotifigens]|uniref:metallophosphoesterase family protein n=1 Tax=Ciceribacter azotifigens TaxID=2069303 RepID=UPI003A8A302E
MRIAILSDIHANRQAFEAVLAAAEAQGAQRFVILGDIVGYGGDPGWCVRKTMELAEKGAVVIRGNHDQAVSDPGVSMNETARTAMEWTRTQLMADEKAYLETLPFDATDECRLYVHADASSPQRFRYVTDAEAAAAHFAACTARVSFCGHVHQPALYALASSGKVTSFSPYTATGIPLLQQRRWLAVMGAVGQPRDGNPSAAFGLYDSEARELEFRRAGYDIEMAAARIRAAGLPESLATRLFRGR